MSATVAHQNACGCITYTYDGIRWSYSYKNPDCEGYGHNARALSKAAVLNAAAVEFARVNGDAIPDAELHEYPVVRNVCSVIHADGVCPGYTYGPAVEKCHCGADLHTGHVCAEPVTVTAPGYSDRRPCAACAGYQNAAFSRSGQPYDTISYSVGNIIHWHSYPPREYGVSR